MSERTRHAVALCAYLAVTLWIARAVLPSIADSYPLGTDIRQNAVADGDVIHMIWATSRNARTLVTHPTRLWDYEICHPLPDAVSLGHHLYAEGLLAVLPYALTGEPIAAYNAVAIAMPWIAAVAMYALAYYWTRSTVAAFVSGALFAFQMSRIALLRWPSIVGNAWTPLALLFAYRLCVTARWRDAAALAALLGMQLLESVYQALPAAVLGIVYGATLLVTFRARLRVLAPKLVAVAAVVALVGAFVATPYLHARHTWSSIASHFSPLPLLNDFAPGTVRYPGTCLLVLGLLGLADRLRRRRHEHDPRLPLAVGGVLVLSLMVRGVWVAGIGWVAAPGPWLLTVVPGLDLGRVMSIGVIGTWLVLAFLAASGVVALLEHRSPRTRAILGVAIIAVVLGETLVPAIAARSFAMPGSVAAAPLDVPRGFLGRYRDAFPNGAVIDLPADDPPMAFGRRAHYVLVAAFHRRPTTTCFTSFVSPLAHDLVELGMRLPDPRAAEALYALGVRSVLVHADQYPRPEQVRAVHDALARLSVGNPRLVPLGEAEGHRLYRLESSTPVHDGLEPLVTGAALGTPGTERVAPGAGAVDVGYRNGERATYRHPDPMEPSRLVVRWYDRGDALVLEREVSAMLPLALAPGEATSRSLATSVPTTPGVYRVAVALADAPERVLGGGRVSVESAPGPVGAPGAPGGVPGVSTDQ